MSLEGDEIMMVDRYVRCRCCEVGNVGMLDKDSFIEELPPRHGKL